MLLRLLFVLLIALNIAVAAWLLLGDATSHAVDPTDAGVPTLKLLAERPPPATTVASTVAANTVPVMPPASRSIPANASSAALVIAPGVPSTVGAAASTAPASTIAVATSASVRSHVVPPVPTEPPTPVSPRRSYRCLAVGPFASQVDLRTARTAIAARTVRSRQRQEQTSESHGWRVYLPAQPNREAALAQAKRLEAKGVKDYFVVTATGELQNSVALGLFHDPANARKRRDEVAAAGFPARMAERLETTPAWWLDVVVPDGGTADLRRNLRNPSVTARPTGCF